MKFYSQIKKENGNPYIMLMPLYDSDAEQVAKLKQNTEYRFEVVQERNWSFHKKVMALFNLGHQNQEQYTNFEHYRKVMTMKAGYYDTVETDKGAIYLPHSISFSSMDEIEFEELFKRLLDVMAVQLDSAPEFIKEQLNDFM